RGSTGTTTRRRRSSRRTPSTASSRSRPTSRRRRTSGSPCSSRTRSTSSSSAARRTASGARSSAPGSTAATGSRRPRRRCRSTRGGERAAVDRHGGRLYSHASRRDRPEFRTAGDSERRADPGGTAVRRRPVRKILAALALVAALAVAATASARPEAAKLTTIKIGVYPSADYAPLFVGLKRNIFKKHGLDVKITYVYTGRGLMAAATSGQLDIVTNSVTAGLNAIIQGLPLKMLMATDYVPVKGNTEVLVKQDSPITSFKQLEGKTVATVNLNGLFQMGLNFAVEKEGGDPSKVKAVPMSPLDEPNALLAGRLDAIELQDPFLSQAKAQGGFRSL